MLVGYFWEQGILDLGQDPWEQGIPDLESTSAEDDGEVQEHPGQLEPAASAAGVS